MLSGQPPSNSKTPFKLTIAVGSPSKLRVMTSLPNARFINSLWNLHPDISADITITLRLIYCHITDRGASDEGKPHFFHHVAATALYESYHQLLIKDKDHGKKAGAIFHKVKNTLGLIERELKSDQTLSEDHREILENFKAEFTAHHNAIVLALQNLPEQTKEHLAKHQNIRGIQTLPFSPSKVERIQKLHPSPSKNTPKKRSKDDVESQMALTATEHPKTLPSAKKGDLFEKVKPVVVFSRALIPSSVLRKQAKELKKGTPEVKQEIFTSPKSPRKV